MNTLFDIPSAPRDYFFVPSNPAANGRLHLGHISGPYLNADILARHRRRQGHRTVMIFGIDAYNSYVVRRAEIEGSDPATVANQNYQLIREDLQALDIAVDILTNPLDPEWRDRYNRKHQDIFAALETKGAIATIEEQSPYCTVEQKFVPDYAVSGTCPECGAGMGGFSCEGCGGYFYPDTILNAVSASGQPLVSRPVRQQCLTTATVPLTLAEFDRYNFSPEIREILRRHLERREGWFKLTHHFDWGLPTTIDGEPRMIVSFMTEYIYNLMHGDLYAELTGATENPYARSSSVEIVCSIGIDNVLAQPFGKTLMSKALGDYKADDGFIVNYFFNLEGQKFSTSRRHVIWASEIVRNTAASSDAVRLYLALNSPTRPDRNFDIAAFLSLSNHVLADRLNPKLTECFAALRQTDRPFEVETGSALENAPVATLLAALAEAYRQQAQVASNTQLDPVAIAEAFLGWIDQPIDLTESPVMAYWWLKGLALLGYPLMPQLATHLWSQLAHEPTPTIATFLSDCTVRLLEPCFEPFASLTRDDLASCLPTSLQPV